MARIRHRVRQSRPTPRASPRRQSLSPSVSLSLSPPSLHSLDLEDRGDNRKSTSDWKGGSDATLRRARIAGESWHQICAKYFAGKRTPNACRKRHERLAKKDFSNALDGALLDDFVVTYFNAREAMWSILAEALNCKDWREIELKVCHCSADGERKLTEGRPTASASRTWKPTAAGFSDRVSRGLP